MAFVIVANLDDLEPGETLFVEELREPICLVRLDDDDVRAVHNTCTHQQQPLHEGTVQDDDTLVCASHNSRFDLTTGASVGIPAVPPLPVYACKIEGDAILSTSTSSSTTPPSRTARTTDDAGQAGCDQDGKSRRHSAGDLHLQRRCQPAADAALTRPCASR